MVDDIESIQTGVEWAQSATRARVRRLQKDYLRKTMAKDYVRKTTCANDYARSMVTASRWMR